MIHFLSRHRLLAGAAIFSDCGRYRYWLSRRWDQISKPRIAVFVLANPSKAGASVDDGDMTIAKCTGFAKRWGCTGIEVVNQRAWIATDPLDVPDGDVSIGEDNDRYVMAAIKGEEPLSGRRGHFGPQVAFVVPGWGDCPNNRYPEPRHFSYIAGEVRRHTEVLTLGVTKNGSPRHPSRLAYSTELVAWDAAIAARKSA